MRRYQAYLFAALFLAPLTFNSLRSENHESSRENPSTDLDRQNATTRNIRTIATAIEMYAVDNKAYPGPTRTVEKVDLFLKGKLVPIYVKNLPSTDGWGRPFLYSSDGTRYTLVSYGKDGIQDAQRGGATRSFDCDIIFRNGAFFQWPTGTQT